MSLINDASLILTPNSVKEGKLYSIIPTNGNGDMTVVRATTATRVNELGLIEATPYNLLRYSEEFSNGFWSKSNVSVTLNQGIAPNNTNTVNKITVDNSSNTHFIRQIVAQTIGEKTLSFFVDKTQNRYVACSLIYGTNSRGGGIIVDTLTETIVSSNFADATFSITYTTIGNFLRISLTVANTIDNIIDSAYISPYNNEQYTWQAGPKLPSYTGDGISSLFVWGAQLVQGSVPKDYFYTTNRLNVPRLNYDSVGGCPSILVEPQRTNLVLRSEEFDDGFWGKINTIVTANAIISPNNTLTTDKLIESNVSSSHFIERSVNVSPSTNYTISVFVKESEIKNLSLTTVGTVTCDRLFNLTNGTSSTGITTGFNPVSWSINKVGDYYRCSITILSGTTTLLGIRFYLIKNTNQVSYLGDGISGLFLWGAQLEQGSYPTSYIPTVASTVTRNADLISKTGISNLIGQTEGTIFIDLIFTNIGEEKYIITVSDTTLNNAISLRRFATGEIRAFFTATTSSGTTSQTSAVVPNGICKLAYIYKSGSLKLFINGVLSFTLTPTFTFGSSLQKIDIGSDIFSGRQLGDSINSIQLYKTALTDAECIALTTL